MSPTLPQTCAETLADPAQACEGMGRLGELAVGDRLGRYELRGRLGAGGMAVVYDAWDRAGGREVALKVSRGTDEAARARLRREAEAMAACGSAHAPEVYELDARADVAVLAMEPIAGCTLERWLETPGTWAAIVRAFIGAGQALAALHSAGFVHRDFKPDNVMIDASGAVTLLDFGLAVASGSADTAVRAPVALAAAGVTRTGALLGTPAYMAPEQYLGVVVDPRTDQFAFCVALYEALFGERPFVGDDIFELRDNTVRGRLAPPPAMWSRAPAQLRALLVRGLQADPNHRFASLTDLLAVLHALLAGDCDLEPGPFGALAGIGCDRACCGAADGPR